MNVVTEAAAKSIMEESSDYMILRTIERKGMRFSTFFALAERQGNYAVYQILGATHSTLPDILIVQKKTVPFPGDTIEVVDGGN